MRKSQIDNLRLAIDCLPVDTRTAMLQGVRDTPIIVGAYSGRDGGICPMLAAHRNGARTVGVAFARAWDRFARTKKPRRATEREIRLLVSHLEASLLMEDDALAPSALTDVIAEHRGLVAQRKRRERATRRTPRPGPAMRRAPVRAEPTRQGWLRPLRESGAAVSA